MKARRQIKRSKLLIRSGVQLIVICLVIIIVAAFFNTIWLLETFVIVAILVTLFIGFEYWSLKRYLRRR